MRYTQDQNFNIKGPGLPESGAVSVGPAELEKAYEAGVAAALGIIEPFVDALRGDLYECPYCKTAEHCHCPKTCPLSQLEDAVWFAQIGKSP